MQVIAKKTKINSNNFCGLGNDREDEAMTALEIAEAGEGGEADVVVGEGHRI